MHRIFQATFFITVLKLYISSLQLLSFFIVLLLSGIQKFCLYKIPWNERNLTSTMYRAIRLVTLHFSYLLEHFVKKNYFIYFLQALEFIQKNHKDFGIRKCKRVPVSGAFHTPLMLSAKKPVMDALKTVQIHPYRIPVYSNVEFKKFRLEPKNFYQLLTKQIVKPVKWEQIMTELYSRDRKQASFPITYECGPGKQLGMFLQKMNNRAFANYVKIEV